MKMAEGPDFYDRALDDPRNSSWHPIEGNQYALLWRSTAAMVPEGATVVELGCGTGRLASLIAGKAKHYVGLDFAPRCIAEARRFLPDVIFLVADLRSTPLPDADVYVANEVMEHLDDDRGLVERIPSGATVILSLPSFDSASHVRHFPERGQALHRYADLLDIDTVVYVPHGRRGRFFHLLRGVRR